MYFELELANLCHEFCRALALACLTIAQAYPQRALVLSGGVCQNRVFMEQLHDYAPSYLNGQSLYTNEKIPANDAGIAAGQLWYLIHQN